MLINSTANVKNTRIKLLLKGFSGAGKTTAIASLAGSGFRPLIGSFEAGLLPLASSKNPIDYIDGTKDDNGNPLAKELRANRLREIFKFAQTEECKKKYDTIVLDSATEISQCIYDKLKLEFPERKDSLVLFGALGQHSRDFIKAFRDLDYHVVITCLAKVEKDDSGKRFIVPDMIGSISDKMDQFFDIVTYIKANEDGTRSFLCSPTDYVSAKDRSGKLGQIETSLGDIFKKVLTTSKEEK